MGERFSEHIHVVVHQFIGFPSAHAPPFALTHRPHTPEVELEVGFLQLLSAYVQARHIGVPWVVLLEPASELASRDG